MATPLQNRKKFYQEKKKYGLAKWKKTTFNTNPFGGMNVEGKNTHHS